MTTPLVEPPNSATLEDLVVAAIDRDVESIDAQLAERVLALDGWIKNGGFLPSAWRKP